MTARGEFSGTIDAHEPDATALAKLKRLISEWETLGTELSS